MNTTPPQTPRKPTRALTAEARKRSHELWSPFAAQASVDMSPEALQSAYDDIHAMAVQLAGESRDAAKRAIVYFSIYEDSQGHFMFPLVATHGSLWGVSHTMGIERRLNRFRWLGLWGRIPRWIGAIDAVRDINRRVFVEIYSTFYFTRYFGRHRGAEGIIKPEVLALYNRVHHAIETDTALTLEERREIYYDIFVHEQHDIVDPGIQDAAALSRSWWLVKLFSLVRPRFTYFPKGERLVFTDFTSVDQRNREGLRALAFAETVGPDRVLEATGEYALFGALRRL